MDRGPWVQVHSGRRYYLFDPRPEEIDIEDIAHGLAHICRYNGHTIQHYSVAEHSVLVARRIPSTITDVRLAALLHDAAEAYLGDVTRPLKMCLPNYKLLEAVANKAISAHFGLHDDLLTTLIVKRADEEVFSSEASQVMSGGAKGWELPVRPAPFDIKVNFWPPEVAKTVFLRMYREVRGAMQ